MIKTRNVDDQHRTEEAETREDDHFLTDVYDKDEVADDAVTFERRDNIPKDRGWAWFVLLGGTLDMLLLIGIVKCSGILFVAFQERFNSSSSMTSLLSTVQNICQSVTSLLAMTFGIKFTSCRIMLFLGSVITCVAYVITSQATDIRMLLFSHGVLQGTGMGFMFPTALIMVSTYFEKRRGFANSIAVSGGSFGGLIFAPMVTKLLTTYGYQVCLLILAGLLLNGCVSAALLRPTSFYTDRKRMRKTFRHSKIEKKKFPLAMQDTNKPYTQLDLETWTNQPTEKKHGWTKNSVISKGERLEALLCDTTIKGYKMDIREEDKRSYSFNDISENRGGQNLIHENQKNKINLMRSTAIKLSLFPNSSDRHIFKQMEIYVEPPFPSAEKPKLITSEGSSCNIHAKQLNTYKKGEDGNHMEENKQEILTEKPSYPLLMNPVFWALLLQGSLICSGTLVAPIFIAPYARDIGVTADEVATLVTALSCVDLFSRIAIGYISDKGWLRRSSIVAIATLVISIAASLLRFYTNYVILLGYAIVLGVVSGAYFSLYAVVLIDYLTLDNFQTCLGVMSLVHGFSTASVFYLVGYLRDTTGSYVIPHNVIGVTTGFGAIILFLLPMIERKNR